MTLDEACKHTGWFDIPGLRRGQRTFAEQSEGLEDVYSHCKSMTVCDIGCAEGLIALECLDRGASRVVALEPDPLHVPICEHLFSLRRNIAYHPVLLQHFVTDEQFDIVLALAVLHKLRDPRAGIVRCTELSRGLVVMRAPVWMKDNLMLGSKHNPNAYVDMRRVFNQCGFFLDRSYIGARKEATLYWERRNGVG